MEMKCSACDAALKEGEPHCHTCKGPMTCTADSCNCAQCHNEVAVGEVKCDACLAM